MKSCESGGHDWRLTMKNELWRGFLELCVPNQAHPVGIVGSVIVVVVRGCEQLWKLGRPVHRGHAPIAGPSIAEEPPIQP